MNKEQTKTTIYPDLKGADHVWHDCWKCSGKGYIVGYEFSDNARCWACETSGGRYVLVSSLRAAARRRECAAEKATAEFAAKVAARNDWETANAELLAQIKANAGRDDFLYGWATTVGVPSDEVIRVIGDILARIAAEEERKANASPVIEGRIDVVGEVLSIQSRESNYGYGRIELKMLVQDDRGFKLWGTLPATLADAERGSRVQFTATAERSRDDELFGFFKRPTKAVVIAADDGEDE